MGIANTEQDILDELKKLTKEPEREDESSEELLREIDEEEEPEEEEAEEGSEEEEAEEEESKEDEEEEEEPEEDLRPAQKRHALKELKAAKEANALMQQELAGLKAMNANRWEEAERLAAERAETRIKAELPSVEIPDKDYEPEKYAIYLAVQLEKKVEQLEARESRSTAEKRWVSLQAKRVKSNPDFMDAKAFLLDGEAKRVKAQYPMATSEQIEEHLLQQEYQTVANAARAGLDPLSQIEFLAWQAGFRGKEKEEGKNPKKGANIETIKRNVKKSASLIGGSSGGKMGDSRSAEQLLNMSISDIQKFGRDKYDAAIRKIESRA